MSLRAPAETQERAPRSAVLTMLGTAGGPTLRRDRSEPSSVLQIGDSCYLIDCGMGTARQLVRAAIDLNKISAIFITHHHPDHDLGLSELIADRLIQAGFGRTRAKLKIYGPIGTTVMVEAALRYLETPLNVFGAEGAQTGAPRLSQCP